MHIYIHHLSFYRASDVADLWWCTAKLASHRYTVCWMPWKANPRSPLQVSQLSWFRFMLALLQYKQASRTRICICLQTTSPSVLIVDIWNINCAQPDFRMLGPFSWRFGMFRSWNIFPRPRYDPIDEPETPYFGTFWNFRLSLSNFHKWTKFNS